MKTDDPALQVYLAHLRRLPFVRAVELRPPVGRRAARVGNPPEPELHVTTPTRSYRLRLRVLRTHLDRGAARAMVGMQGDEVAGWILFAPHIGRPLGEELRHARLNYVDRAGNCFVALGNRYVAQTQGRPAAARTGRVPKGVRAAGARVLFVLLAEEELLGRPLREIAEAAGTGHTAVSDAMTRLDGAGAIVKDGRRRQWLPGGRRAALDLWLGDYGTVLRPALFRGRFRTADATPDDLDRRLEDELGPDFGAWYGGVAGGYRLVPHYRGVETILHVRGEVDPLARRLRAFPDPDGPLCLFGLPGPLAEKGETPDTVHPLLVYAEMLQPDDERATDAAALVREHALREFA